MLFSNAALDLFLTGLDVMAARKPKLSGDFKDIKVAIVYSFIRNGEYLELLAKKYPNIYQQCYENMLTSINFADENSSMLCSTKRVQNYLEYLSGASNMCSFIGKLIDVYKTGHKLLKLNDINDILDIKHIIYAWYNYFNNEDISNNLQLIIEIECKIQYLKKILES